jgi:hypothetical protein
MYFLFDLDRFDRNHCDTASFGFLKTILFPPSVRNCLDVMRFHDQLYTRRNPVSHNEPSLIYMDSRADPQGYNDGYHAIRELPFRQNAKIRDLEGDKDSSSFNRLRTSVEPLVYDHASQSHISNCSTRIKPVFGGKAGEITPTRPRTTRSSLSSPISSGKSHRSPASALHASPSPLKILQHACNDGLLCEAKNDLTPRRNTISDGK